MLHTGSARILDFSHGRRWEETTPPLIGMPRKSGFVSGLTDRVLGGDFDLFE